MKSKLTIFLFLLLILSLDGTVLAKVPDCCKALSHDGVNRVSQRRRKPRPRKSAKKAKPKVYAIQAEPAAPDAAGAMPPTQSAPEERPTMAAPPPPPPGENSSPAPARKSAPRIKPPTVMIKPPTE